MTATPRERHRVVVVGGGFGGLYAAKQLGIDPGVALTVVDRRNFHLFQPMLYQVATGALSPGEIAQPLRSMLRKQRNTTVILGEAVGLDPDRREVLLSDGGPIGYDSLIVARVGGGPTGVELAGSLGEIARDTLRRGLPGDQNRGDVAVIGRLAGVTDIPWLGPLGRQGGFTAWLLWLGIHIFYLIGFANRIVVLTRWAFSFLTHGRGTRLITGESLLPPIAAPEPPFIHEPEPGPGEAVSRSR
ncbi:MAG: FAD-dependent oxidoreductase [Chloroflexota bacterium]